MTQRSGGLPSPPEVAELLGADFARARGGLATLGVSHAWSSTADGDNPLDLDAIAALSRSASERLDAIPAIPDSYVLEVSSPGVDRPLTTEKHFRRARGRKVELDLADGSNLAGRLGDVGGGSVRVVAKASSDWAVRLVPLSDIVNAVVQVEFSSPGARELELLKQAGTEA